MNSSKEKCEKCHIAYPQGYLSPMMVGTESGLETIMVCGICALEIKNEVHGGGYNRFQGEMAEEMRQMAIAYRKKIKV